MDNLNLIHEGDIVVITFLSNEDLKARVLYVPSQQGENWIVETETKILYIQNYSYITKSKR